MTQRRDYITRWLIKGERKRKKKKKEEKADRMCTSYRSDTIIEITVNDRQGEGERRLSKFMADSRLRRITNAHFAEIRASHIEIFSIELGGQMNRRDPVGINNGEIHQCVTKIVMIILSHREGASINRG